MTALERAEEDIQRGDLGLARQRLTSFLNNEGYDPDLLAKIGQISFDMQDLFQAGRYWLLSNAESPEVDRCIELFVNQSAHEPAQITGQLPRAALLARLNDYPELVRKRIQACALEECIGRRHSALQQTDTAARGDTVLAVGCVLAAVSMVAVFIAGIWQIVSWVFLDG